MSKVTWQGCVGAESRPLTLVPVIMLAATTCGYVIPKAGASAEMSRLMCCLYSSCLIHCDFCRSIHNLSGEEPFYLFFNMCVAILAEQVVGLVASYHPDLHLHYLENPFNGVFCGALCTVVGITVSPSPESPFPCSRSPPL